MQNVTFCMCLEIENLGTELEIKQIYGLGQVPLSEKSKTKV